MKGFVCTALILFCSFSAFTQTLETRYKEFNTVYTNGFLKVTNGAFREIRISQIFVEGKPESKRSIIQTTEIASHIRHSIITFAPGDKTIEMILANGRRYTREGNGKWKAEDIVKKNESDKPDSRFKRIEESIDYKEPVTEIVNNKKNQIYEIDQTFKLSDSSNNTETPAAEVRKFRFAEDGRVLKQESETIYYYPDKTSHDLLTTIYEIDPTIKIEIPILK